MQTKFLIFLASAALAVAQSVPSGSDLIRIQGTARPACVGAPQASPGAPIISMPCGPRPTMWVASQGSGPKQIMLYGTGLCIRPRGSGPAPLGLVPCSPGDQSQRFSISNGGTQVIGQNNLCMTLPSQNGQPIFMAPCNSSPVQKWSVSKA